MSECRVDGCGAPTPDFVCKPHMSQLERAVGDMPGLLHDLSVAVTRQAKVYRAVKRVQPDAEAARPERAIPARLRSRDGRITLPSSPMPVNLDAAELYRDAWSTLATWAMHLAERAGVVGPDNNTLLGWLLRHVQSFACDEAGAQAFDEITWLHGQLERAVDRSPSRLYVGPCGAPNAEGACQRSLFAYPGAVEIVCDGYKPDGFGLDVGCRAVHDADARDLWKWQAIMSSLAPLDLIRATLPKLLPKDFELPPAGTWRSWRARGRLLPKGEVDGVELFSCDEVVRLVQDEKPRRGPRSRRRAA